MTIGKIIAEPLRSYYPKILRQDGKDKVKAMMLKIVLLPNLVNCYYAVELGTYDEVYHNPQHLYTRALMSASPVPDLDKEQGKQIQLLEGELPSPINRPTGCVFRTRCLNAGTECAKTRPLLEGSFHHVLSCLKVDPL